MAQTAKVSRNEDADSVEFTHPTPTTPDEMVEEGMAADLESVVKLATLQWRIKAQAAARRQMKKAAENGRTDTETMKAVAQDAADAYTYGGRQASSVNLIDAEDLIEGDEPSEQELAILEKLDAQEGTRVIWGDIR